MRTLRPQLQPLMQDVVGDIRGTLWVLMGTIGLMLLVACAPVANLLLVRWEDPPALWGVSRSLPLAFYRVEDRWPELEKSVRRESVASLAVRGGVDSDQAPLSAQHSAVWWSVGLKAT